MTQAPNPPSVQPTHRNKKAESQPATQPVARSAHIRSFVRRQGRLTEAQARALSQLWPRYGIAHPGDVLDLTAIFEREAPAVLEIGFGNGEVLARAALESPERNFLGIEVHRPGLGALLMKLAHLDIPNVRVMDSDAIDILQAQIPDNSFNAVWIFFPDPWPKARHRKRRLIRQSVAELLSAKLKAGGILHTATDWKDYADQMLAVLDNTDHLANTASAGHFSPRPRWRPATRFEKRGLNKGHRVYDLIYKKTGC